MPDSDGLSDINVNKRQADVSMSPIPQIVLTEPTSSSLIEPVNVSLRQTTPLPLTKDLLQRKNKLDRLLIQKEKNNQQQDYFSPSSAVTAGLGISTPNDRLSGLRSRRTNSSRISNSNRSEPEKSQHHSEWSYDLDVFKSSTSGSSKGKNVKKSAATSISGSSNRNSVSMRAYSANHRYMDKNTFDKLNQNYERPDQHLLKTENKSKYYLLDLLYHAVIRVVHSRAPETKDVSKTEKFDFNQQDHTLPKSESPKFSLSNDKLQQLSGSPNIINHSNRNSNRFSWLSVNTSIDGKSIDYESTIEKKMSIHEPPFIIPQKPTSSWEVLMSNPLQGNTLYMFPPNNKFRTFVWKSIRHR